VTVGALIRYRETPVGPYREVLASPALLLGRAGQRRACRSSPSTRRPRSTAAGRTGRCRRRSRASTGRAHPGGRRGGFELDAEGRGWSVHATVHAAAAAAAVRGDLAQPPGDARGDEITFASAGAAARGCADVELETARPDAAGLAALRPPPGAGARRRARAVLAAQPG
jgi:hypothetical protein